MSIRTRLLLLVLAILLPAFIAAALAIGYVYSENQAANRSTLQETTRALALLVDNELETREVMLQSFADSPLLDSADLKTFYQHVKRTADSQESAIVLADTEGRILFNTAQPFGASAIPNSGTLAALRKQHGPDGTIISDLYFSPHRKTHSFSIQVPVRRAGKIVYYLSIGTNANQMQPLLDRQKLPGRWIGAVIDRNGLIVVRSQESEQYVGRSARQAIVAGLKERGEGFFEGKTLAGIESLAAFSRAPKSGWGFVVNVPRGELDEAATRGVAMMAGVSMLLLGFGLAGAFAVARRTAASMESLRASAELLGRGEPLGPTAYGIGEMDAVSMAMAQASDEIRRGKAELERRIEDAVARAEQSQKALLQSQKLDALGRLTGGIAHDFNNVLQTLTSGLQLANMSSADPRVQSLLQTCERAVDRATELTRQLMAFARVQDVRMETTDLEDRISQTLPLLQGALPSNIDMRLDIGQELWPVRVDPLQFELAVLNLTINARDAMPQGGTLRLSASNVSLRETRHDLMPGDYVRVAVADTGGGMSQEVASKALDPFFTTKDVGKGSGLGLPQAYGFARQTGGTLVLDSQPGQGTEVTLYLPRSAEVAELASAPPIAQVAARVRAGTLLFVEDDPMVREVMQPSLEAAGFRVRTVRSGEEALELLNGGEVVDFVFSDIVMPGRVSGIDLAQRLRETAPGVRVVLATGYTDRRVMLENVRTLAKPYGIDEVIAAFSER